MSIEKKSLISTLKTTKKANVANSPAASEAIQVTNRRPKMAVTNRRPKMAVTNRRPKMAVTNRRPKRASETRA
ncbi:MAG TPA: hypothetical protein VNU20_06705 [Candidatus Sulfotelmatobacter sp.]|jgi:hypothetical protein|nr:hypothetical protein [Candidatus Sulfotelmatobacter sp.]